MWSPGSSCWDENWAGGRGPGVKTCLYNLLLQIILSGSNVQSEDNSVFWTQFKQLAWRWVSCWMNQCILNIKTINTLCSAKSGRKCAVLSASHHWGVLILYILILEYFTLADLMYSRWYSSPKFIFQNHHRTVVYVSSSSYDPDSVINSTEKISVSSQRLSFMQSLALC